MKRIIILICILTLVVGCTDNNSKKSVLSIEEKVEKIMKEDNYIIVDVRTKAEYESGHIVDAINIEYDAIDENVELDKNKKIMVYCRSGQRSRIAYNVLKELGYDVLDLGAYDSIKLEKE